MCSAVPCTVLSSFSSYWWWLLRGGLPSLLSPSQIARTPCMPCQGPPARCVRAPSRSPGTLLALSQAPARTAAAQLRRRRRMASAVVMGTTTQTLIIAKLGSALARRCKQIHSHRQIRRQIRRRPRMRILWHRPLRPRPRRHHSRTSTAPIRTEAPSPAGAALTAITALASSWAKARLAFAPRPRPRRRRRPRRRPHRQCPRCHRQRRGSRTGRSQPMAPALLIWTARVAARAP
jgi:hypothetical protein